MKSLTLIIVSVLIAPVAWAQTFGLGLVIGDPTGLSGKYLLSQGRSVDAALAWSLGKHNAFYLHSTYLFEKKKALAINDGANYFDAFYGVGARFRSLDDRHFDSSYDMGARGAGGLKYNFKDPNIEVFGEAALIVNLLPSTGVDLDMGIGARFFFD